MNITICALHQKFFGEGVNCEWGGSQLRNVKYMQNLVGKKFEGKENIMRDLNIEEKVTLERPLGKGTLFIEFCASQVPFVIHVQCFTTL